MFAMRKPTLAAIGTVAHLLKLSAKLGLVFVWFGIIAVT